MLPYIVDKIVRNIACSTKCQSRLASIKFRIRAPTLELVLHTIYTTCRKIFVLIVEGFMKSIWTCNPNATRTAVTEKCFHGAHVSPLSPPWYSPLGSRHSGEATQDIPLSAALAALGIVVTMGSLVRAESVYAVGDEFAKRAVVIGRSGIVAEYVELNLASFAVVE